MSCDSGDSVDPSRLQESDSHDADGYIKAGGQEQSVQEEK